MTNSLPFIGADGCSGIKLASNVSASASGITGYVPSLASSFTSRAEGVRADLLALRDRVAVLDGEESPDSDAGCCAAEVVRIHNAIVTGGNDGNLPDDAA